MTLVEFAGDGSLIAATNKFYKFQMDSSGLGKQQEHSIFNMPELNLNVYVTYICGSWLTRVRTRGQEKAY